MELPACYYSQKIVIIRKLMGNQTDWVQVDNQFTSEQTLQENLIFIESRENKNDLLCLGTFDIFRFNHEPYDYVMKHRRMLISDTINQSSTTLPSLSLLHLPHISHKLVARLHNLQILTKRNLCMKETVVQSYSNYYAITLQEVIEERKRKDVRFTTGELWYIVNSLVQLSIYLQKLSVYYGIYLPKNIHLSPQGYIKVYLYHLTQNHKHFLYYHLLFDRKEMHKYLPIPPECLSYLEKESIQLNQNIDLGLMDSFGIGMICMEAMLFNSTRKYYLSSSDKHNCIVFDEKQLKADIKELKSIYPLNLVNLIEKMVTPYQANRYSFAECREYIKSIRDNISINGTIKMVQDDQNQIAPKVSYKSVTEDMIIYHNVLRSITSNGRGKLQVAPIKSVSRREKQFHRKNIHLGVSVSLISSHSKKQNKLTRSNLSSINSVDKNKSSIKPTAHQIRIRLI